jgi:arylsulfatase A
MTPKLHLHILCALCVLCGFTLAAAEKPNIVVILTDDMGYGDLSCQGHPLIRTPHLDRLAAGGQRWTSFYASAPMCNPSRVAMMTGRMPIRIHRSDKNRWQVLPPDEVTLAEMLKKAGYATAYVGKWGITSFHQPGGGAHPNDEGFDYFYGLVGSNDAPLRQGMKRTYESIKNATSDDFPITLYRQTEANKLVFESWESLGTEKERGWRGYDNRQQHDPPLLFDLTTDVSERRDIAAQHPEIVEKIREAIARHEKSLGTVQP